MQKILISCLISLFIFSSAVFAATEFKPTPFFNGPFTYFWHKQDGFGVNTFGMELSLLKYRSFYFLNFGIGLANSWKTKYEWRYYGYWTWEIRDNKYEKVFHATDRYWAKYKDHYFSGYFKFAPIKIALNLTKNKDFRNNVFLDVGIFSQNLKRVDGFEIGLSFSFDMLKNTKKPKEEEEECEKYL